jgi:hypothetical protein
MSVQPLWQIAVTLVLTPLAAASTIEGSVINRSTGRPSPGDEVVLYRVDRTMHEEQRTKSDTFGDFHFDSQEESRYLIAVSHQGVSYHSKTMSLPATAEVAVYDSAQALKNIHVDSDTMFFEANSALLNVTEFFVLSNQSSPPQTLSATETYDFSLPRHAVLSSVLVQPPETLPLKVSASRRGRDGRYAVSYPIRPGVTRIRIMYSFPYSGRISIVPSVLRHTGAMALMIPETMDIAWSNPNAFVYMGKQNGLSVYSRSPVRSGASIEFTLSGQGIRDAAVTRSSLPGTSTPPSSNASMPESDTLASQSNSNHIPVIAGVFGFFLVLIFAYKWSVLRVP